MRQLSVCLILLLSVAFAADRDLAGRHAGEWKSDSSGNGGAIRFALDLGADGKWKCDLSFALGGGDVKTTMREVKVQDSKVAFTYDFDVQGVTATSRVTGEWTGSAFKGTYQTTLGDGSPLDAGTWNASRVK